MLIKLKVRFQVLMAGRMKMAVSSAVVRCRLVEVYRLLRVAARNRVRLSRRPDIGGSKHLRNAVILLASYSALQLQRQPAIF